MLNRFAACSSEIRTFLGLKNVKHPRAGARAVDLGGQAFIRGGQSLKLSTKAAVFKKLSLLIGGPSMSIGEVRPPWPLLGAGPEAS